jgi:hypothetical protein
MNCILSWRVMTNIHVVKNKTNFFQILLEKYFDPIHHKHVYMIPIDIFIIYINVDAYQGLTQNPMEMH